MTFHPQDNERLCVAVGEESQSAGPFMSRALEFVPCQETAPERKQWVIKNQ